MLEHIHGKIASGMYLDLHELEALIRSLPEGQECIVRHYGQPVPVS